MQPYSNKAILAILTFLGALVTTVHALGSSCSTPLTKGNAGPNDPFWLQNIKHQCEIAHIASNVFVFVS